MKFSIPKILSGILVLLIFFVFLNDRHEERHIEGYFIAVVAWVVYYRLIVPLLENRFLLDKLRPIIKMHETTLSIQRNRLIRKDVYGNESQRDWNKEIQYFIKNTLQKELSEDERDILHSEKVHQKVFQFIDKVAREKNIYYEKNIQFYEKMSGEEYEFLCKDILTRSGWFVDTTKRTGDQGVDLIATKNNIRVAIQCKRFINTVGNSAVQEVVAGKVIYKANYGVVVSNAAYTRSAQELARATNVKLLHHYHLLDENFYEIV